MNINKLDPKLIVGVVVLLVILLPTLLNNNDKLAKKLGRLFNDNLNLLLLIGLVCIVIHLNTEVGTILCIAVILTAILVNRKQNEGFQNKNLPNLPLITDLIVDEEDDVVEEESDNNPLLPLVAEEDDVVEDIVEDVGGASGGNVEGFAIRDGVPVIPTPEMRDATQRYIDFIPTKNMGNQDVHHPHTYQATHPAMNTLADNLVPVEEEHTIEGFANKQANQNPNNQAVNLGTQDLMGCRYDASMTPMNGMFNGPPLASCNGYDLETFNKSGTIFYPLNA